jgi:CRISPR-associated exonuclease Cas4
VTLIDEAARRRALTSLNETLLVEASAGTGKTALMAGRAALLLASGVEPRCIAAITFTELAAGELALRIRGMVQALIRSNDPPDVLRPALPVGLTTEQRANLLVAASRLDELTATTIHGFCQGMIRAYAVEANLDPGATVMDASTADAIFQGVFSRWLGRRLSDQGEESGPIGVLAAHHPLQIVDTLRELALLRRSRPTARPPAVDLSLRADHDFVNAVEEFERWFARGPSEPRTADILAELRSLADFFDDSLAARLTFKELWRLAHPRRTSFMKTQSLEWRNYGLKGAWRTAAGAEGVARFEGAKARYEACQAAFGVLVGSLAGAIIVELSSSLDDLLQDYAAQKRAAAALDFDDLLFGARRLLRKHDEVRRALGRRYRHIFVDEFQDTDPLQAEIIFALASDELPETWTRAVPRPGSLFLVGDPKQAIYRFRGAHVAAYTAARDIIAAHAPDSIVQITANFRSAPKILEHINSAFEGPLRQMGQPGFVPLSPTVEPGEGAFPCVSKIVIDLPPGTSAAQQRDVEAEALAELCRSLIGAIEVRRSDGSSSPLRPGDIALLAPTGTELWRYERALEQHKLGVASQAGKTLMRRQETQDVLALLRTLANPHDTIAFGALMRGPLVGLTESKLLAIARALPPEPDGTPGVFTVRTNPTLVADPEARGALEVLQFLRRRAAIATPAALLLEAAERLNLRVALALRTGERGGRAIANLDTLITMARPYRVRGLATFVADLDADWQSGRSATEGRIDESDDAISLVTIHSAKGLEWPVVIPINTGTFLRGQEQFVHRQSDDTLHWILDGLIPPHLADAQAEEVLSAARERERLWYVAVTRARDLLILPELTAADERSWSRVLDLGMGRLLEFDAAALPRPLPTRPSLVLNSQTKEVFDAEAAAVAAASPGILWRRPSEQDHDRVTSDESSDTDTTQDLVETPRPVGAGRVRGVLLHKLLEEMLTGELPGEAVAIRLRAADLIVQLTALESDEVETPDASECAAIVMRARNMPEIAAFWPTLEPEVPIYASEPNCVLVAGRADAISVVDGRIDAVIDWKSDLEPDAVERAAHVAQLSDYLRAIGAPRGAIVYLTLGQVVWVTLTGEPRASD